MTAINPNLDEEASQREAQAALQQEVAAADEHFDINDATLLDDDPLAPRESAADKHAENDFTTSYRELGKKTPEEATTPEEKKKKRRTIIIGACAATAAAIAGVVGLSLLGGGAQTDAEPVTTQTTENPLGMPADAGPDGPGSPEVTGKTIDHPELLPEDDIITYIDNSGQTVNIPGLRDPLGDPNAFARAVWIDYGSYLGVKDTAQAEHILAAMTEDADLKDMLRQERAELTGDYHRVGVQDLQVVIDSAVPADGPKTPDFVEYTLDASMGVAKMVEGNIYFDYISNPEVGSHYKHFAPELPRYQVTSSEIEYVINDDGKPSLTGLHYTSNRVS